MSLNFTAVAYLFLFGTCRVAAMGLMMHSELDSSKATAHGARSYSRLLGLCSVIAVVVGVLWFVS